MLSTLLFCLLLSPVSADPPLAEVPDGVAPPELSGELLLFDLRRAKLFLAEADGGNVRALPLDATGRRKSSGVAAGTSAAAVAGTAITAETALLLAGVGLEGVAAGVAVAGGAMFALPVFGIIKGLQVAQRKDRPMRDVTDAQPMVAFLPGGDRLIECTRVGRSAGRGNMRLIRLRGPMGDKKKVERRYGVGGTCPDASPDGSHVVFVASPEKGLATELYVLDLESGRPWRLTNDGLPKAFPRWSPDGEHVAYHGIDPETSTLQVFVLDAAGGAARRVSQDSVGGVMPSWTPDGSSIVFASLGELALARTGLAGGETELVTASGNAKLHPQVSPDGRWVMYLESSTAPVNFPPEADELGRLPKRKKIHVGSDFRLKVAAIDGSSVHDLALARPGATSVANGGRPMKKSNLFWFRWHSPRPREAQVPASSQAVASKKEPMAFAGSAP